MTAARPGIFRLRNRSDSSRPDDEARIDATACPYAPLLEAFRTGRFCGTPQDGPGPAVLVEVLRRHGWRIDMRRLAAAVPHFPNHFGLDAVRNTLRRVDVATTLDRVPGRDLAALPAGSVVLSRRRGYLFIDRDEAETPHLSEHQTGRRRRIRARRTYKCLVPLPADLAEAEPAAPRTGWTGQLVQRFAPQNRALLALTLLSNLLVVVGSLLVTFVFNTVIPGGAMETLAALAAGMVLLLAMDLSLRRAKSRLIAHVSGRLDYIVSTALFDKLLSLRLEMLTAAPISDQMNRLRQFETLRDVYAGPVVAVLFELPFVAMVVLGLYFVDPAIGLVLTAAVAAHVGLGLAVLPRIRRASARMVGLRDEVMRLQEETLSQRAQIVERGLGRVWAARLAPRYARLGRARREVEQVWRALGNLVAVLSPLFVGAVVFVGAVRVTSGALSGGALIACMILSTRALGPVQQALLLAVRSPELSSLLRQISAMMRLPAEDAGAASDATLALQSYDAPPQLRFDGVVLRYGSGLAPALRGVSFTAPAGSFTAITGPSGAGKTSLLRCATGLYRAQTGTVLIGPVNVGQLDRDRRARLMGHLGHDALQFHGTLAQNLALTAPETSRAQMERTCALVGLSEVIAALPEGLDTRFDHRNRHRFSPAFRTKFALAQVILKRPRVLILDEPEASLTPADERHLIDVIRGAAGPMTVLMVTQRPSLWRQADQLVELRAGQVAFAGPPPVIPSKECMMPRRTDPLAPATEADALTASYQIGETHDTGHAGTVVRIICAGLLAFLAWAALAPVHEIVSGEGQIQPEGRTTRIEHLDGGIVARLLVAEGDRVEAGQPLLQLDGTDLAAEARKLEGRLAFLDARIAGLDALLALDLAQDLPTGDLVLSEEIGFHLARVATIRAQARVAEAQHGALQDRIAVARDEDGLLAAKGVRYAQARDGSVSRNAREAVQREALAARATLAGLEGEVAIQEASIALLAATEQELVGQIRHDASQSRAALIDERDRLSGTLSQIAAQRDRLMLRSDRAGRVGDIAVRHSGEVLAPGETVLEIVPRDARPLAEVEIPADRIGGIAVGLPAKLKVLTFDFTRFGEIEAQVARIAPTSTPRADGTPVYRVGLDLAATRLASGQQITPGMTVVADIRTARRTVLSYLLKPMRVLKDRAFTEG
ncbi:HlyD family type I secretion periplasmic adaptor subunit [Salipiger sp. IMCC34102]|uniref:HlyD family type I secretion periplasmic adaptor subunit n=1 Tax=Salipiger sp. IMCC34102 TaxID=2510647 RepID=UPI00101DEC01|nr:HlyD family type I secretion periplasmic adaptor subunit [Salipiger sp. IMCC34102]RYH01267.1 HlyD family type I secretion periplasmic adaptor subunit [Salipiger sp. IMCC34102]